jgi:hypothetical protein
VYSKSIPECAKTYDSDGSQQYGFWASSWLYLLTREQKYRAVCDFARQVQSSISLCILLRTLQADDHSKSGPCHQPLFRSHQTPDSQAVNVFITGLVSTCTDLTGIP